MFSIAIDGPSGSGKSTLAKALAKKLGIIYVDTGALYRTVALAIKNADTDYTDEAAVVAYLPSIMLSATFEGGVQRIFIGKVDVGESIRTPEIAMIASRVSSYPEVRAFLLDTQRTIARSNSVVMDGRDIGTVILPNATVKIFLTADNRARAKRRHAELLSKGQSITFEEVLSSMNTRDENDKNRKVAPAIQAEDAILLDNSNLSLEETVAAVISILKNSPAAAELPKKELS